MRSMQVYLVGGAVRDQLLGRAVKERDWVVVGATPAELEHAGYRTVGQEFPVFLHPESKEEYALARLERKVAPGYRGFVTEFSPTVTLEEDLQRRDLTINAMARAADGQIIDPYGGQRDLTARVLRHVSAAFCEDPVRILRVARFAARFAPLGFSVAPETMALMAAMVRTGEVNALVSERVWRELELSLREDTPERAFEVLRDCGALPVLLPEFPLHPEATQALAALRAAADAHAPTTVRWAALLAGMNEPAIDALCARLRVPNDYRELALLSARLNPHLQADGRPPEQAALDPQWLLTLLEMADALRRPERFALWLAVLGARTSTANLPTTTVSALTAQLQAALTAVNAVKWDPTEVQSRRGAQIATLLRTLRLEALRLLVSSR